MYLSILLKGDEGYISFVSYFSSQYSRLIFNRCNSTIEAVFRNVGFGVQFRHHMISGEGYKKFGADYWKRFIDEHPFVVIVAEKPF